MRPIQRLLVMGSPGSGKSTFAKRLSDATGIPLVSLDALYWRPGWMPSDAATFRQMATDAALAPRWIMDGDFIGIGAGEVRRQNADAVIWFDLPRQTCIWGVLKRIAGNYGRVRPAMSAGCPERFDLGFMKYVWTYRRLQRPRLVKYLESLRDGQALICFTCRRQADEYIARVAPSLAPLNAL